MNYVEMDHLLIVTALDCKACIAFKKNNLNSLKKLLKKESISYEVLEFNSLATIKTEIKKKNPNLFDFVRWVPSFILVNKDDYESGGDYGPNEKFKCEVMNGNIVNGNLESVKDRTLRYTMDPDSIIKWINSKLNFDYSTFSHKKGGGTGSNFFTNEYFSSDEENEYRYL